MGFVHTCGIRCLKSFSVSCANPVPVYDAHKPKSKGGMLYCCWVQLIHFLISDLLQLEGSKNRGRNVYVILSSKTQLKNYLC